MFNPLDYLPETVKERLIDGALTRVAAAAERAGSAGLSRTLRALRSDTPLAEEIAARLGETLSIFESEWLERDPGVTRLMTGDPLLWTGTAILDDLVIVLLQPRFRGVAPEYEDALGILRSAAGGALSDDCLRAGLDGLIVIMRDELFAHPKLQAVHQMIMQRAQLESNAAIFEQLQAINAAQALAAPTPAAIYPSSGPSFKAISRPPAEIIMSPGTTPSDRLPDFLTPTLLGHRPIEDAYRPNVGDEVARWIADLQRQVIITIETADFAQQASTAERMLAAGLGRPEFDASAHYLLGEARRLQADFTPAGSYDRSKLLTVAADAYGHALAIDPHSIRSLRGLGRVHEVQGDIGKALELYKRTRDAAQRAYDDTNGQDAEFAHEVMRSTRHYVACIARSMRENRQSAWHRESRQMQLHGYILESCELHQDVLPAFRADADWMAIEWFMGLVLLAQSFAVVKDHTRCVNNLLHALSARLEMLGSTSRELTAVERGNLLWWCQTARESGVVAHDFLEKVELIRRALDGPDPECLWASLYSTVELIRPPWKREMR